MNLEPDDFRRLAFEVHRFLSKGDIKTRLATSAKLYLEFPDVGSMHEAHKAIVQIIQMSALVFDREGWRYVDDHTIILAPYAGISVVLTCVQRFDIGTDGSVGYRDIVFVDRDLPK